MEITPLVQRQVEEEEEELQMKPFAGQINPLFQRQPIEEEEEILQTKGHTGQTPEVTTDLESRIRAMWGGGQPLPVAQRSFMERRFGVDFSQVRVHTDSNAVQMTKDLNAEAFTHEKDMYFGAGRYSPGSSRGNRLIAHELTHVVQQGGRVSLQRFPYYNVKGLQRKDKFHIQPIGKAPTIQRKMIDITLPSGKKIKVNCDLPPPPAPGKAVIPCRMKDIKPPTGKQKTACEKALNAAKANSGVKKIIGNLKKLKGCSIPTMDCKFCTAGCKGAGAWHFPKAIYICADRNPSKTSGIGYLKHELTHELQDCRKDPDVSCSDRMKMEIEAYKAGGRNFESSLKGAVWSSCYVKRCNPGDINNGIAAAMKKHYDSL